MTRINLVPVEELTREHLLGENKEITRVFGLSRKAQFEIMRGKRKLPEKYTLGDGHVTFFYDKLGFIADRYESIVAEMIVRGYKPNPIPRADLLANIDKRMHGSYVPDDEALALSRGRIADRLAEK